MITPARPPRVAILGARGIGQVHARVFRQFGADVCAVLGSTQDSAAATAQELAKTLGIEAKPFFELDRLLAEPLDAVSICTPPQVHFSHLQAVLERQLPVFCEKPLFWEDGDTAAGVFRKLEALETYPNRRLFVNTSNAAFIDAVRDRLPPAAAVDRFYFRFHTQGPARGPRIALDLMPHGLSLLIRHLGPRTISSFKADFTETDYRCTFSYGTSNVEFDFREGEGPRDLAFRVNDRELRRVQEGRGATYRVYLQDVESKVQMPVEDPFATYISLFLRCVNDPTAAWSHTWQEAVTNMRLMSQALLP
ncbi:MAG: dehydrogenase [Acidobacteria bacterium]|nr:dehydrogenase [Acidobacteriota bacterium]